MACQDSRRNYSTVLMSCRRGFILPGKERANSGLTSVLFKKTPNPELTGRRSRDFTEQVGIGYQAGSKTLLVTGLQSIERDTSSEGTRHAKVWSAGRIGCWSLQQMRYSRRIEEFAYFGVLAASDGIPVAPREGPCAAGQFLGYAEGVT